MFSHTKDACKYQETTITWFWQIKKSELREWLLIPVNVDELILEGEMTWLYVTSQKRNASDPLSLEGILLPRGSVHRCYTWLPLSPVCVASYLGASICLWGVTIPLAWAMLLESLRGSCSQLEPQLFNHSNSLGGLGWQEANDGTCIVEVALWKSTPGSAMPCDTDLWWFTLFPRTEQCVE